MLELLQLDPHCWTVLFMQGGGTLQFASTALNACNWVLGRQSTCSLLYHITGTWSGKALDEARKLQMPHVTISRVDALASTERPPCDVVYYCANETIEGVDYVYERSGSELVVCDASSCLLSRAINFDAHDVVFAGAQKNLGMAGVTVVLLRTSHLSSVPSAPTLPMPTMLDYGVFATSNSLYNTPPTVAVRSVQLMLQHILNTYGSAEALYAENAEKCRLLYKTVDHLAFQKTHRSVANITWSFGSDIRDKQFLAGAKLRGLHGLAGHRSRGGLRASLFNGVTIDDVRTLIAYIAEFVTQ